MKFLNYVALNYKQLFYSFKQQIINNGLYFDEDIFSETILKCNKHLEKMDITEKEMKLYFWKSFKTNILREANYLRTKTSDNIPENIYNEDNDTTQELFNEISKLIINKFGYEKYRLFILHINGATYKDIESISNIKCAKYTFRKIRDYVRMYYTK